METLPIDINYNKLLEWLISRRHCGQHWQPLAATVRQKIIRTVENLNESETDMLYNPSEISYFQIKEMLERAKNTESGKKNLFGQYASQSMKDWADIIKLYEKDGTYLGETAQIISRCVNYEIPAIKRQIAKCQQLQKECERKESEFANSAAELRKQYAASCKQIGIEGKKIKTELSALVNDLPAEFDHIAVSAQELTGAVDYYDDFVSFLFSRKASDSLPMLKFVQSHGNVRVYEWRTGSPPEVTEEQSVRIDLADEQDGLNQSEDIDWGGKEDDTGIDFGEDIDFGIADITVESGGHEEQGCWLVIPSAILVTVAEEMENVFKKSEQLLHMDTGQDFLKKLDKETSLDSTDGEKATSHITVSLPEESGVARGEDALSLLDNPRTRNLFIDDLMELESFLNQRLVELSSSNTASLGNQLQGAPASMQLDASEVEAMTGKVQGILRQFTSHQMQHLMLIRNSPRYVDRLRDTLRQTLVQADKMILSSHQAASGHRLALEEERQLEPQLEALRKHTRWLQRHMEKDISQKYQGRQVHIMGEINMI